MPVNTYKKKPIEVDAVQLTDENKHQVLQWAQVIQPDVEIVTDEQGTSVLRIPTLEGEMDCSIGDFLVVEPFPTNGRNLYPCKRVIFEKTYDLVVE